MKRVFITGVSSGIGLGLAEYFLGQGDLVWGVSRRTPESLVSEENFRFQTLDLQNEVSVPDGLNELLGACEGLDLAILNAGALGEIGDMKDTPTSELRRLMDINVWSYKWVLDALYAMNRFPRQVVTLSSGAAVNGNRGWNGYSISKAALNMLTKLYAAECLETHFCAIAPGLVDTAMQDYLCGQPADDRFASLEALKSRRHTEAMPTARELAPRLATMIDLLPTQVTTGSYVDIRQVDWI